MIIDSHIHLDAYNPRVVSMDVLAAHPDWRALVPATHPGQTVAALARWGQDPRLRFCAGLHPWYLHHAEAAPVAAQESLATLAADPRVVAIGEVGLDRRRIGPKHPGRDVAEDWVRRQAAMACDLGLPLVLHVVGEHGRMQTLLRPFQGPRLRGVIHAFVGTSMLADSWKRLGFVVGVGPAVLRENAARTRQAVSALPGDGFVLETDAPFVRTRAYAAGAVPPVALREVAREVAQLRGVSLETVFAQSARTAQALFGETWR